jgi:hypothetical protein
MRENGPRQITINFEAEIVEHFEAFAKIRQDKVSKSFSSRDEEQRFSHKLIHISRVLQVQSNKPKLLK